MRNDDNFFAENIGFIGSLFAVTLLAFGLFAAIRHKYLKTTVFNYVNTTTQKGVKKALAGKVITKKEKIDGLVNTHNEEIEKTQESVKECHKVLAELQDIHLQLVNYPDEYYQLVKAQQTISPGDLQYLKNSLTVKYAALFHCIGSSALNIPRALNSSHYYQNATEANIDGFIDTEEEVKSNYFKNMSSYMAIDSLLQFGLIAVLALALYLYYSNKIRYTEQNSQQTIRLLQQHTVHLQQTVQQLEQSLGSGGIALQVFGFKEEKDGSYTTTNKTLSNLIKQYEALELSKITDMEKLKPYEELIAKLEPYTCAITREPSSKPVRLAGDAGSQQIYDLNTFLKNYETMKTYPMDSKRVIKYPLLTRATDIEQPTAEILKQVIALSKQLSQNKTEISESKDSDDDEKERSSNNLSNKKNKNTSLSNSSVTLIGAKTKATKQSKASSSSSNKPPSSENFMAKKSL